MYPPIEFVSAGGPNGRPPSPMWENVDISRFLAQNNRTKVLYKRMIVAAHRTTSVERALSILLVFSPQKPRLRLVDIANETGLHKSTILRLLNSMALYGFVDKSSDGLYSLGASVWRLGLIFRQDFSNGEDIRPVLRMLVDKTDMTASFLVRAGSDRVCLYRENSENLLQFGADEGMRLSLYTGASGLVLRHFTGDKVEDLSLFNNRGTVNLEQTRNSHVASISTPVFSYSGDLKGALTISGENTLFDEKTRIETIPLLERAADHLQRKLAR